MRRAVKGPRRSDGLKARAGIGERDVPENLKPVLKARRLDRLDARHVGMLRRCRLNHIARSVKKSPRIRRANLSCCKHTQPRVPHLVRSSPSVLGAADRLRVDLDARGIVLLEDSKSVIHIRWAILDPLGIPTYILFDADRRADR